MDIESAEHKQGERGVVRRAVQIGCSVRSELWDGPAPFLATDLSPDGLKLCSPLALPEGQDVVVTFTPPRWPDESGPLNVVARVQHVALPRRKSDPLAGMPGEAGMGLSFLHIDPTQRALLHLVLRGLPPPLPACRVNDEAQLALDELETVLSHDGLQIQLAAEAPLLTATRPLTKSEPLSHANGFTSATVLRRRFRSFRLRPRGSELPAPVESEPVAPEQPLSSEQLALH
jgi:hypothetical protein